MKDKFIYGFTLAEVLIALAIIGVVAALTIPSVINNSRKLQYQTQFKKVYNQLTNTYNSTKFEFGGVPACYYYSSSAMRKKYAPSDAASSSVVKKDGKYEVTHGDGSVDNKVPDGWNGPKTDCSRFSDIFFGKFRVLKTCTSERKDGQDKTNCIPYYKGREDITNTLCEANSDKANNSCYGYNDMSESEKESLIQELTFGSSAKRASINKGKAYIINDGTIIIKSSNNKIFYVDINGKKGPNKWGHDMFSFVLVGDPTGKTNKFRCYGDDMIENPNSSGGGYSCTEMMKMK